MYLLRTLIFVSLSASALGQSRMDDSLYLHNTYEIVAKCFANGQEYHQGKLFGSPLAMPQIADSLLAVLIRKEAIVTADVAYLQSQINDPVIHNWEPSRLKGIKIDYSKKKFRSDSYGISLPVYSQKGDVAIVYLRYLGKDIFEQIMVFQLVEGQWNYFTTLYSVIGS